MASSKAPGGLERWTKSQLIDEVGKLQRNAASLEDSIETYRSAAAELRESETRLAEAQRMARIGNWDRDNSTEKIFWSDEMFRILGRDKEAFQPKLQDFFDSIHPDDRESVESATQQAIEAGGSYQMEHRIVLPSGEVRSVLLTGEAYFDSAGREIRRRGTIQDITERTNLEKALSDNIELLASSERIAHLGSWEIDYSTGGVVWSDELYRILGFDSTTFDGRQDSFLELVHPDDRELIERQVEDLKAGRPLEYSYRIVRPSGEERVVEVRGEVTRFVDGVPSHARGYFHDITERRKAEQALRESEARLGALIDNTVDGIITIDAMGRIEKFNPAAERLFGYAAAEVIGGNVSVLMPPPFRDAHDSYIEAYLETGVAKILGIGRELVGRRKDGSVFSMELAVSEVNLGKHRIFTGICRDISERKRAESELTAETELVQLLHRLAAAANDARDVDEVTQTFLDEVCAYTGWPVGHAYQPAPGRLDLLVPSNIWHLDDPERFAAFRDVTLKTEFEFGMGLPGRVLAGGKPAWIVDVTKDPNFPRARLAAEIGVRTGFALPVLVATEVAGVLEFYTSKVVKPDEALIQVLSSIGTHLGRVIERKRAQEEIAQMANYDELTGLPSVRLGRDRAQAAVARARRNKTKAAILFVDLDGFKAVNDTWGHNAGDQVLTAVAERLTANVREIDTVARIGGDEFIVVLSDVGDKAAVANVARKLIDGLSRSHRFEGQDAVVGTSIGIALYPDNGDSTDALMKRADEAMYAVKHKGKNDYAFSDADPTDAARGKTSSDANK